jgi:precorrin-6Y C5,15-methyltransferase (decarboxylating)
VTGWFAFEPVPGSQHVEPVVVLGYDGRPLVLEEVDLVVGGRRHLDGVTLPGRAEIVEMGPVEPALQRVIAAHADGKRVVVLASGDPGFFGIVRRLAALRLPVVVRPALSSVAMAFGRLGAAWDTAAVVSAHGRDLGPAVNTWRRATAALQPVAVLTDGASGPAAIIEALGEDFTGCHVFERLGAPDEAHVEVLSEEPVTDVRTPWTVIGPEQARRRVWNEPLVVVHPGRAGGPAPWHLGRPALPADQPVGWALPDEAFAHRDGMLTKQEVRALVLARLAPAAGTLVWDIGAGSGSVGIECSRLGAAVIAVEQADTQHLVQNALSLGGPVRVVKGKAPDALVGLPHPDAVFIGGGGPEVVAAVAAVRPARVVVALATLERVAPTVAALEGYEVETVLLQVSHLQPLGEGHRLVPANPVFVVSGVLP